MSVLLPTFNNLLPCELHRDEGSVIYRGSQKFGCTGVTMHPEHMWTIADGGY